MVVMVGSREMMTAVEKSARIVMENASKEILEKFKE